MPQRSRTRTLLVLALLASLLVPLNATTAAASAPPPNSLMPNGSTYNSPPTLSWGKVTGAVQYRVRVANNLGFSPAVVNQVATFQTQYAPPQTFQNGTYYWQVQARTTSQWGEWSNPATFTISRGAPTPLAPPNGTVIEFPTGSVGFAWSEVPGARSYQFEWDTEEQFTQASRITSESNGAWLAGSVPFDQVNYWRARADLGGGNFTSWSDPQSFYLTWPDQVGKGRPQLTYPPTTSPPTQLTDVELRWNPVLGAGAYNLQISASSDFNGPLVVNANVLGTTWTPARTLLNGNYWWRVQARTRNNDTGPWSATGSFTRAWPSDPSQGLPGVGNPPTLTSPSNGGVVAVAPLKIDWNPVDRASRYEIQFSSEPNFSNPTTSNCYTTQTVATYNQAHLSVGSNASCNIFNVDGGPARFDSETGLTYWRVRGIDDPEGVLGIWSPARSFQYTAVNPTPTPDPFVEVELTQPEHCPAGATCGKHASTPEMRWNPQPAAAYYMVWVAKDPNFTNIVGRYRAAATVNPSLQPRDEWPDNDAGQAYYWHVQVCRANNTCSISPESGSNPPARAFQKSSTAVVQVGPGIMFDPLNPPNLETIPIVKTTPRFTWKPYLETSGSNLAARNYRIQVSDNPQFTTNIDTKDVDQPFFTPWDRTYPEGPLYWRVAAIDGSGNILTTSPIYAIRFVTDPPPLVSPPDGAHITSTPTLTWEVIPNSREYRFELWFHPDGPDEPGNRVDDRSTLFSSTIPYDSLEPGWYKWRVRGWDNGNRHQTWSNFRSFFISGYSPDLLSPNDGAQLDADQVIFTWETDGATPHFYRWYLADNPNFASQQQQQTTINSWIPTAELAANTWYWRVGAFDVDGSLMGMSDTRTFTRKWDPSLLPGQPHVTGSPGALNISWVPPSNQNGLTGYELTVQPGNHEFPLGKEARSARIDGLINGQEHQVELVAKTSGGLTDPKVATGTPNGCEGTPFRDVGENHPFCTEIRWMYTEGLSTGSRVPGSGLTQAVIYEPTTVLSRQAMAAFLYRYEGSPPSGGSPAFADVGSGHTFFSAIQWMNSSGMSTGTPNPPGKPLFKPGDAVSRQATAAFLHRYNGNVNPTLPQPFFADVVRQHPFYRNIQWMAQTGMSTGTPNPPGKPLFKPVDPVTRMAMAAFMYRYDLTYGD